MVPCSDNSLAFKKVSKAVSTKIRLANSPEDAPPMPSANTQMPSSGLIIKASSLLDRLKPGLDLPNMFILGKDRFDVYMIKILKNKNYMKGTHVSKT
jgi:hypothetical protein